MVTEQVCGAMVRRSSTWRSAGHLAGGGLSIPYREGEEAIDTAHYGLWNRARADRGPSGAPGETGD